MRLLIATAIALAAIATPAAAQKLDARRSSGGIDGDRAYCRFAAYPELRLEHRLDGSEAMGTWQAKAIETPGYAAYAYFLVMVARHPDTGVEMAVSPLFGVDTGHGFARTIASVRVLVDDVDTGISLHIEGTMRMGANATNTLRFMTPRDSMASLGQRLLGGRLAQLDLLDDQGIVIRSYHFDLRRLHDAPKVLAQAEWKCGDAVNR